MNVFIAIAPCLRMKYVNAEFVELFKYNKKAIELIKSMGPELLPFPASINPFLSNVHLIWEKS